MITRRFFAGAAAGALSFPVVGQASPERRVYYIDSNITPDQAKSIIDGLKTQMLIERMKNDLEHLTFGSHVDNENIREICTEYLAGVPQILDYVIFVCDLGNKKMRIDVCIRLNGANEFIYFPVDLFRGKV